MTPPRRLLAVTTLVTAALALSGSPASAAPGGDVTTNVFLRHLTLPVGGPTVDEDPTFFLSSDEPGWANEVSLTVDASAASAVADVVVEAASAEVTCATTGAVARCTVPGPHRIVELPDNGALAIITVPSVRIGVTPKPGAAAGDTGTLTVTARADDGPTTTETATVRIGQGVNLTAVDAGPREVVPGGSTALRPQVRNTGPRDVEGLALVVNADDSALAGTNFGNCVYDHVVTCTFDTTLETGGTYEVSAPFTVRAPRDAAVGSRTAVSTQWLTLAEWQDWQAMGSPGGRQGTGADLELDELVSASAAGVPQADIDGDDNGTDSTVTVTGGRRADVAAVGATITGPPGEARTIDVGMVNHGPGTLHYPLFFNNLPQVAVSLPPGIAVVRADDRCSSLFDEDPAGPPPSSPAGTAAGAAPLEYVCQVESMRLRPGQRLSFAFTVRVAPGARDAEGSVEVRLYDGRASIDRDAGNNDAPINLSLGGAGGGLPVTGTTTATVAGTGGLLLLLGIAIIVALRRRTRLGRERVSIGQPRATEVSRSSAGA